MNILYLHGWGSDFSTKNNKVQCLGKHLGSVVGYHIDYTKGFSEVFEDACEFACNNDIDIVVGCSMGGHLAQAVGDAVGIPFVAINPSIHPSETLRDHIGSGTDYAGHAYTLTEAAVSSYPDMGLTGYGLVLLDMGDEFLDSEATKDYVGDNFVVQAFEGGSHRFEHTKQSIEYIKDLYHSRFTYGL